MTQGVLARLYGLEAFGIKLGLENVSHLAEALGHPERAFRTLHVAGTNGKGSVTAMVHAALASAGVRTARYTSPHLAHITERFVVGDAAVSTADFEAAASLVLDTADDLQSRGVMRAAPTFFEATTVIGFELFRRAGIDVAVVEVGLGGRFDATNVIAPIAGAITTIGFDHQQYLGTTLGDIAFEKAGIIKPGMTVVSGTLPPEAMAVVRRVSSERGARLVETASTIAGTEMVDGHARVAITTRARSYPPATLALRGAHQAGNAAVAVALLEAAADTGLPVAPDAIRRGLEGVSWPARLELLHLPNGKRVLLDAAHNADGATALAAYLRTSAPPGGTTLVVGVMRDKAVDEILGALLPVAARVVVTAAATPRALPAAELAARVAALTRALGLRLQPPVVEPAPAEAVATALAAADEICVAGSIFLVGAVREHVAAHAILPR